MNPGRPRPTQLLENIWRGLLPLVGRAQGRCEGSEGRPMCHVYGFRNSQGTRTEAFGRVSGSSKRVEDQGRLGYSPTVRWPLYSMYTNYRYTRYHKHITRHTPIATRRWNNYTKDNTRRWYNYTKDNPHARRELNASHNDFKLDVEDVEPDFEGKEYS